MKTVMVEKIVMIAVCRLIRHGFDANKWIEVSWQW